MASKGEATEETIKLYNELVASVPEIDRKGKTIPYTSLNGHMFSFIAKEGYVAIRLTAEDREKFIEKYNTEIAVSYGAVMKEYVVIPDSLLKDTNLLAVYLKQSLVYIKTLKPKPTKKKQ